MNLWLLSGVALGIAVGIVSGLIGVGGGLVLVPALVYLFKMDQHMAQGTSLAMLLPPTGILAFLKYYQAGHVDWKLGLAIAAGVFVGGYFGGEWAQMLSAPVLRKTFAVLLVGVGIKMFLQKG